MQTAAGATGGNTSADKAVIDGSSSADGPSIGVSTGAAGSKRPASGGGTEQKRLRREGTVSDLLMGRLARRLCSADTGHWQGIAQV